MDFIDIANELPRVTGTLLRHLTVASEPSSQYQTQQAGQQAIDGSGYDFYYSPDDINVTPNHPFLSKTAEAELYLLATNFLLCKFANTNGFVSWIGEVESRQGTAFLVFKIEDSKVMYSCALTSLQFFLFCRCGNGYYHYDGRQNLFSRITRKRQCASSG